MSLLLFINLVIALVMFFFGFFIFIKYKESKTNKNFAIFTLITGLWVLTNFLFRFPPTVCILFVKLTYTTGVMVLIAGLTWLYSLGPTYDKNKKDKLLLSLVYLLGSFFLIVSLFDNLIIQGQINSETGFYEDKNGPLMVYYTLYSLFVAILCFIRLLKIYKEGSSFEKTQYRYVVIGFSLFALFAITFSLILPAFNIFTFISLDSASSIFLVGFTAYAIIKNRLLGIPFVLNKFLYYISAGLIAYGFFHFAIIIFGDFLGNFYSPIALTVGFLTALFFACTYIYILGLIKRFYNMLFFKRPQSIEESILSLIREVSEHYNIFELDSILHKRLNEIFSTKKVYLYIKKDKDKFRLISNHLELPKDIIINEDPLLKLALKLDTILVNYEINSLKNVSNKEKKDVENQFQKYDIDIAIPLINNKVFDGIIFIGPKKINSAFTQEEIEALDLLGCSIDIVIKNALAYKNLEEIVAKRTEEIENKNKKLERLLSMRGEFLNIASHQLRTPVSVIRGYAEMLLKGNVPENQKKHFLETIMRKANKQKQVISDILNASEMDTGEMDFDKGKTKIEPEIFLREIIERKKEEAENKGLKLKLRIKNKLPSILVNKIYFEEAVSNLINNSLQYTKEGSITVEGEKDKDKLKIRIIDTGIGIPKKEINDLFSKFKRGSNANSVHTDGSGLGLFIVKNILKGHGGKVFVEKTELGKGTTFTMELPVNIKP